MAGTYQLICTACSYGDRATGLEDAYALAETHRRREGEVHFVEMTVVGTADGGAGPHDGTPSQSAGPVRQDTESDGVTPAADD